MFIARTLQFERQPVRKHIVALVIVALILFLPALLLPEYRASDEAIYCQLARDIVDNGNWLSPKLHGMEFPSFPMYSWLVVLCSGFKAPTPFSTRLPAVLALFALAGVSAAFARRVMGNLSGMVAACVIISCWAGMHFGLLAQSGILETLFLTCAWFAWLDFGKRKRWNLAWGIAFVFVFLGVLTSGAAAIVKFYLPLIFFKNYNHLFGHFLTIQHVVCLLTFVVLVVIWTKWICPNQPFLPWNDIIAMSNPSESRGFFSHLFYFTAGCLVYLAPWSILFWTPFCLAFRQFEPNGITCGFLRTIVMTFFVCYLLMPKMTPSLMMPTLGAMAVLIGIHFRIPANRYQKMFSWITKTIGIIDIIAFAFGCVFWLLVYLGKVEVVQVEIDCFLNVHSTALILAIICAVCLVMIWTQVIYRSSDGRVAMTLVWSTCGARFAWLCLVLPVIFFTVEDRRLIGLTLDNRVASENDNSVKMAALPENVVIYYRSGAPVNIVSLASMNHSFVAIGRPIEDLPNDVAEVYMISSDKPAVPQRQWIPVTQFVNISQKRTFVPEDWKNWTFRRVPMPTDAQGQLVAVYKGTLLEQ